MIAMGEHMAYSMGCEASGKFQRNGAVVSIVLTFSGVISRVGSAVTSVNVGDRVTYIIGLEEVGCFHTFGRTDQSVVSQIPDDMSYEEAAGLPTVWATVLYGLREVGKLAKGESVLIHAAAGGVGQAAINYAKHVGAKVFATVSTPQKRDVSV
jgi:NADPH:quinone reductase-like Zn-dependent oxidoreductase